MTLRKILSLTVFLLLGTAVHSQDWSHVGKQIHFSDTLQKAKKIKDIHQALANPDEVFYLDIGLGTEIRENQFILNHISRFRNLRKLILVNNSHTILLLPDSLWSLKQLEYLDLLNFPGNSSSKVGQLKNLKYLSLSGFAFSELPASILELRQLVYLDLSCNYLSSLPDSMNQLSNLKEIELTNNCFTGIPKSLVTIEGLEHFTFNNAEKGAILANGKPVCNNTITSFPEFLGQVKNLKTASCFFKVDISEDLKKQIIKSYPQIKFT
jgi:Leucine-rich repeat (LRR) protein